MLRHARLRVLMTRLVNVPSKVPPSYAVIWCHQLGNDAVVTKMPSAPRAPQCSCRPSKL